MIKIAGAVLIIAATSLMGISSAAKIREEYKELQYLQRIMFLLQSEIRYARSYLGEAFFHIGNRLRSPYREWLLDMSDKLEHKSEGLFCDIWEAGIERWLSDVKISEEEKARLIELGGQFSTSDIAMQMKTLELYQEQLALSLNEKREGMRTKIRLCHCLGVMSGIFLTVLLI